MNRINPALALAALLFAMPATAQDRPPARLNFAVYAAGLNVVLVESLADFAAEGYRIDLNYRSVGMFGTFVPSQIESFAQGSWAGLKPSPTRFATWGTVRNKERRVTIDYERGQPVVRRLVPEAEDDRDPVPPALQRDTIDTLSAMAYLVRAVTETGKCDGTVRTFDGRRVFEIEARTAGEEPMRADYRSSYTGSALRCDMKSRQLAGFQHDADDAELKKVLESQAWLAPILPGYPKLPVRVVFSTRFFGAATAYLTDVTTGIRK